MCNFKAKMHQIQFRLGLCPRPRWGSLQGSGGDYREGKKGNGWGAIQFLASGRHRLSYATELYTAHAVMLYLDSH